MGHTHTADKTIKRSSTYEDIGILHDYGLDIKSNQIFLMGEETYSYGTGEVIGEPGVEYTMANRFIRNMHILMRQSEKPILINMKTCGGDWTEGMAIYNIIKACPNKTIILNYTHARSMSSLILQAADKRVMMPDSTFMFHGGTVGYEGTTKQFLTESEMVKKTNNRMLEIYINSMKKNGIYKNKPEKYIKSWLNKQMDRKEEVYLTAEEAIKFGFADDIFGQNGHYDWSMLTK